MSTQAHRGSLNCITPFIWNIADGMRLEPV